MKFGPLSINWGSKVEEPPQASGGATIETYNLKDPRLAELLREGNVSAAGQVVNSSTALKTATAYRATNLICGAIASLPLDLKRRVDAKRREDADNHPLWKVLRKRPNNWQTPSEFKKLMQAMVLLRGNGYALKVVSFDKVKALIPLIGYMRVEQNADLSLSYHYTRPSGTQITFKQEEIFHLRGMSTDGLIGQSVISYAAEALGFTLATTKYNSALLKNGVNVGGILSHQGELKEAPRERLKSSLEDYRSAENAGKMLILEGGMKYEKITMTSADAQLLQNKELTHIEVAMFFGVPPFMLGLTSKVTSWGSGIEQMGQGFVAYTLQDWMTMWAESIERDLIEDSEPKMYARMNPAGLIRGDIKTRYEAYLIAREGEWMSANDVREKEDEDPIEGGDEYENPRTVKPAEAANKPAVVDPAKDIEDEDELAS